MILLCCNVKLYMYHRSVFYTVVFMYVCIKVTSSYQVVNRGVS